MSTTANKTDAITAPSLATLDSGNGPTEKWLAVGGILAAVAASTCCVVPFGLFFLGVSGAWIGDLTAVEPFKPYFLAFAAANIGYGFYRVYRKPKVVCVDGYCATPKSSRIAKAGLWIATGLFFVAAVFPYAIKYLYSF